MGGNDTRAKRQSNIEAGLGTTASAAGKPAAGRDLPGAVLSLQQTAGNRATVAALRDSGGQAAGALLMRQPRRRRRRPQPQQEPAPTQNVSFEDARHYVGEWFDEAGQILTLVQTMRERAFLLFQINTATHLDESSDAAKELFEEALELVPQLKRIYDIAKTGRRIIEFLESMGPDNSMQDFQAETVSSMAETEASEVQRLLTTRRQAQAMVQSLRNSPGDVNLLERVQEELGPRMDLERLRHDALRVRNRYELLLYRQYYVVRGGAHNLFTTTDAMGGAPATFDSRLVGIPDKVRRRIDRLNGWRVMAIPIRRRHIEIAETFEPTRGRQR